MKINFSTKIILFEIKKTGHLKDKKDRGLKCTFQTNLKVATYFTCVFHFSPLTFNSIIS